jgi:hypothetical protein
MFVDLPVECFLLTQREKELIEALNACPGERHAKI